MKHIKGKLTATLGLAAGYVLGSRAGRDRYEKIKSTAAGVWKSPKVQEKVHAAETAVKEKVTPTKDSASEDQAEDEIRPS